MLSKVPAWERVYVIIVLATACRAFEFLLNYGQWSGGAPGLTESSPLRFTWLAILYAIALALLLIHHGRDLPKLLMQNKLLVAAVVYIIASTFWSVDPSTALRRSLAYGLTVVFCLYLVLRYPPVDILRLAAWALLLVAIVSIVVIVLFPEIGVEKYARMPNTWKGICSITTAFGRFMALGILIVWSLRRTDWALQRYDVVVLAMFVLCTYQAQAATAMIAVFCGFVSMVVIWSRSPINAPIPLKLVAGGLVGGALVLSVPFFAADVLDIFQRDITLTNRIYVWGAAYEQGWKHPLLGVGYGAFWIETNAAAAFFNMFGSLKTLIGNGHNGYLDAWLELGFVGLGFLVLLITQAFIRLTRHLIKFDDPFSQFYGGLLIFILVYSIAEKVIFVHSELTWILFTTGLVALKWRMTDSAEAEPRTAPGLAAMEAGLRRPAP